jgi:preprotein translocase YajC subunit
LSAPSEILVAQNVPPKAPGPGVVVDSSPVTNTNGGGVGGSPLANFLPLLLMLVVIGPFFWMMNRKQKKESAARAALKRGDKVTLASGLIGELAEMDDRVAKVKIASGVTVQALASTVSPFAELQAAAAKDSKEAKAASEKK